MFGASAATNVKGRGNALCRLQRPCCCDWQRLCAQHRSTRTLREPDAARVYHDNLWLITVITAYVCDNAAKAVARKPLGSLVKG